MPRSDSLGQFEQLVLTAVLTLGENAYGVTIHKSVQDLASSKAVTLGAIYVTLDRLEDKGFEESTLMHAINGFVFGNLPLYVVMLGGASLLVAAVMVTRVEDVADKNVAGAAVIHGDEQESLLTQGSVQPVPSTGLIDKP